MVWIGSNRVSELMGVDGSERRGRVMFVEGRIRNEEEMME